MTKKRILDLVSTKKRDTMVGYTQSQSTAGRYFVELISADNFLLWCPTSRLSAGQGTGLPTVRNTPNVFWKGFSDNFSLETDTSDPWLWRRIVFTMAQRFSEDNIPTMYYVTATDNIVDIVGPGTQNPPEQSPNALRGFPTYFRTMEPLPVTNYDLLVERIFQGIRYVDWSDYTTAKVDTSQINVISDRVRKLTSGNDAPILRSAKHYVPLNKTMRYPETEFGTAQSATGAQNDAFACSGTTSQLKDVYVMDYFRQPSGAPANLKVTSQSTVYWHEK